MVKRDWLPLTNRACHVTGSVKRHDVQVAERVDIIRWQRTTMPDTVIHLLQHQSPTSPQFQESQGQLHSIGRPRLHKYGMHDVLHRLWLVSECLSDAGCRRHPADEQDRDVLLAGREAELDRPRTRCLTSRELCGRRWLIEIDLG